MYIYVPYSNEDIKYIIVNEHQIELFYFYERASSKDWLILLHLL